MDGRDCGFHSVSTYVIRCIYNRYRQRHINVAVIDTVMFTRILTDVERKKLQVFVEKGEVPETLRLLVSRIRRFKPRIEEDLTLMKLAEKRYQDRKPRRR
jgi:hypothetical protein